MPTKTVKIMGKTWKVKAMPEKAFYKLHDEDDLAVTIPEKREIHLPTGFSEETLVHELTHAYFAEVPFAAVQLSAAQVEEAACELLASRGFEILALGRSLYKTLR